MASLLDVDSSHLRYSVVDRRVFCALWNFSATPKIDTVKYDPFGRRIYKSSSSATSIFAYDGDNLIEETNSSGTAVARYSQGLNIDEPLAMLRSSTTSFYDADGLGWITSLTNSSGSVAQSYTFDSFGNVTASSGSLTNPFQYTARENDPETGLYYYRARYYDPAIGRFLAEDSLRWSSSGRNFYGYADENAANFTDPTGHDVAVVGNIGDINAYVQARNYLLADPKMAAIIHKLEGSAKIYYIKILSGANCNDRYDSWDQTIYWNPTCGLVCTNGSGQSAALGLGHEMDHAANGRFFVWPTFNDYDNTEEKRVVEGSENSAAQTLGEGTRHDHRGTDAPNLPSPTAKP